MPLLFSYGTLRRPEVQMSTFGRVLTGDPDALVGFAQAQVTIADPGFAAASGTALHAMVRFTGRDSDRVEGLALDVSEDELVMADRYEPAGYVRIRATLATGRAAWVYAEAQANEDAGVK